MMSIILKSNGFRSLTRCASNVRLQSSLRFECYTVDELETLGAAVATGSTAGDVLLLQGAYGSTTAAIESSNSCCLGDLGAGKTCFSRGFIRLLSRDAELTVTSPTYLLDNTYSIEHPDSILDSSEQGDAVNQSNVCELHHMDLYRLPTG